VIRGWLGHADLTSTNRWGCLTPVRRGLTSLGEAWHGIGKRGAIMAPTSRVLAAIVALTTLLAAGGTDLRLTTALLVGALLTVAWSLRSDPSHPFVPGPARRVALWAGLYVAIGALGLFWSVYPQATVVSLINLLLAVSVFILAGQIQRPLAPTASSTMSSTRLNTCRPYA